MVVLVGAWFACHKFNTATTTTTMMMMMPSLFVFPPCLSRSPGEHKKWVCQIFPFFPPQGSPFIRVTIRTPPHQTIRGPFHKITAHQIASIPFCLSVVSHSRVGQSVSPTDSLTSDGKSWIAGGSTHSTFFRTHRWHRPPRGPVSSCRSCPCFCGSCRH